MKREETKAAPMIESPAQDLPLQWVSHPVRHEGKKTLFLFSVVLLGATGVWFATGSFAWSLLAICMLLFGVYDFLLPTTYCLSTEGAQRKSFLFRRQKTWDGVLSYYVDHNGVLLSPFATPSRLEGHRGLYLRFQANRDDVLAYIRKRI